MHPRHRLRAGRVRPRDARGLARPGDELPRARAGAGNDAERCEHRFLREPRRASPWIGPRAARGRGAGRCVDTGLSYHDARQALRDERRRASRRPHAGAPAPKVVAEEVAAARETVQRLSHAVGRALRRARVRGERPGGARRDRARPAKPARCTISGDSKDYLAALSYVLEPEPQPRASSACSWCATSRRPTTRTAGGLRGVGRVEHEMRKRMLRDELGAARRRRARAARGGAALFSSFVVQPLESADAAAQARRPPRPDAADGQRRRRQGRRVLRVPRKQDEAPTDWLAKLHGIGTATGVQLKSAQLPDAAGRGPHRALRDRAAGGRQLRADPRFPQARARRDPGAVARPDDAASAREDRSDGASRPSCASPSTW